jgi:hypothetical protein
MLEKSKLQLNEENKEKTLHQNTRYVQHQELVLQI